MAFKKENEALGGNYKIASMKVFGSTENFYGNVKKYRRVYDQSECRYLYADLAIYNKLFDETDWSADVKIKCIDLKSDKQVCEIVKSFVIPKNKNIFNIREGWGTPDPGWWKKGSYEWVAMIGESEVGRTRFYVTDKGVVTNDNNPYFTINSVKLFESPKKGTPAAERKYLKEFNKTTCRYINIELDLDLKNDPKEENFPVEFLFNYYNDAGLHKAQMEYFRNFTDKRTTLNFDTGYGAEAGGFWYEDTYILEAVFMDQLIGVIQFKIGNADVEQEEFRFLSTHSNRAANSAEAAKAEEKPKLTFEQATAKLQELIGLKAVKTEVEEFATYLQFLKIREKKGFKEANKFNLNTVFTGNPGTGKTTVANMLGQIYLSLDLLSKGHVVEVGRAELVAEFIGQTAPKVKKAIEKARGGILFIDEAYALSDRGDDGKDFGKEVIEVLLKEMSDGKGDIAIVFAGYPKEMQTFLNTNPGLKSRIQNVIHFPDYTPEELLEIAEFSAQKKGIKFEEDALALLYKKAVDAYRDRNEHFGNARFMNGLVEEAKANMALRLMHDFKNVTRLGKEKLSTVLKDDVSKIFIHDDEKWNSLPIDDALLQDCTAQLHELVGLESVKKEVDEMVKLVRYYRDIGKDVTKAFSLHTVFVGNPGTGKTTVARLLIKIYKALGILERGHLVEADRKSLVAGFSGQTAIKTTALIDSAIGGGLFIDEAYALTKSTNDELGQEAIETLLKRMEDQRGEFMVIVAGYPKEMRQFLEANPGLMSRFDKQLEFKDYTKEELIQIGIDILRNEDLVLNNEALEHLSIYIGNLVDNKHKYFGNARTIRKIALEVIRKQNLRLAEMAAEERNETLIQTVVLEDVKDFDLIENQSSSRKEIGFKRES